MTVDDLSKMVVLYDCYTHTQTGLVMADKKNSTFNNYNCFNILKGVLDNTLPSYKISYTQSVHENVSISATDFVFSFFMCIYVNFLFNSVIYFSFTVI